MRWTTRLPERPLERVHYFEDFHPGQTLELGSVHITAEQIVAFAEQFDPQPFHTDPERARSTAFGGLVASGWQTAGLFMRLYVDGWLRHTISMGSPGVDELRWPHPVRPGDTLSARATFVECRVSRSRPDRGIVRTHGELFNQDGTPVLSLLSTGFFGRRPG